MRECIDFDGHFADYTSDWMKKHTKDYRNYDEMEADMPRIYNNFLNTPAPWLQGITPGAYFTQFEDPKDLVDWLCDYCRNGVPIPDTLQDQIMFVGIPCEKRLVALLKDEDAPEDARMTAIGLLREMESDKPKMTYINWQLNRKENDELCDNALESLVLMGNAVVQPILEVLPKANKFGQEGLLDVLTNFPATDQVFKLALRLFRENPDRQALFAGYLGKIGDDRALPDLIEAAKNDDVAYLDYIELRCAIEQLGGTCPEHDFTSDPDYEALNRLGE